MPRASPKPLAAAVGPAPSIASPSRKLAGPYRTGGRRDLKQAKGNRPPYAPHTWAACTPPHRHGLQGLHDDPVDLIKQLARHLLAPGALQVEPQVVHGPLAPVDVVVVLLATGEGQAQH